MAGTRPSTPEGPAYLPIANRRQVVGAQGVDLTNIGANMSAKASDDFFKALNNLAGSALDLSATYSDTLMKRDTRDFETQVESILRRRKVDNMSTQLGAKADGLLDREDIWQKAEFEKLASKDLKIPRNAAKAIWDKNASAYLNRMGTFMLEQNKVAEVNSKFAALNSAQNTLATSNVGEMNAYLSYADKVERLYGTNTKEGLKAREAGLDIMIQSWAEQNPRATLKWFNENKNALREGLGKEFTDISKFMDRTRKRIDSEIKSAELNEARRERNAAKLQKKMDDDWVGEQLAALTGGATSEDYLSWDPTVVMKEGRAKGISGQALKTVYDAAKSIQNNEKKKERSDVEAVWFNKAVSGELTDDDKTSLFEDVRTGRVSATAYNRVMTKTKEADSADRKALKPVYDRATKLLKTAISPRGGLDQINPATESRYIQMEDALSKYIAGLPTLDSKKAALDISKPDSFVNQLIQLNKQTPQERLRGTYNSAGLDYDWRPVLPNEKDTTLPEADRPKPGMSARDYIQSRRGK